MKPIINQQEAIDLLIDFFDGKKDSPQLFVEPTGWGKSILAAYAGKYSKGRTVILQPSKELLDQNFTKFLKMGGENGAICSASKNQKRINHITFATIGTIKNEGKLFKEYGFTNMLIDEAHMYPRESDSMLGRFLEDSGISKIAGMTATPFKLQSNVDANGVPFSKLVMLTNRSKKGPALFKDFRHITQISDIINYGRWSPLQYEHYDFDRSKLVLNSVKSDFTEDSLNREFENQYLSQKIIDSISRHRDRKARIVFVQSISDAEELHKQIPGSVFVHSKMDAKSRERALLLFTTGRAHTAINVGVLLTGFDYTLIDHIIWARASNSLAIWYQGNGRGVRIDERKKDCIITDLVGNYNTFGPIESLYFEKDGMWRLFGEKDRLLTGWPMHDHYTKDKMKVDLEKHKEKLANDKKLREQGIVIKTAPPESKGLLMPFGKYKGNPIFSLPGYYIKWLVEEYNWSTCYLPVDQKTPLYNQIKMYYNEDIHSRI